MKYSSSFFKTKYLLNKYCLSAHYIQVLSWEHSGEQKSQESLYSCTYTLVGKILNKINKAQTMLVVSARKMCQAGRILRSMRFPV